MKKRLLVGTAIIFLVLLYAGFSLASVPISIWVNGKEVVSDTPAMLINGRTMVPLRVVAESLGAKVSWVPSSNQVNISYGDEKTLPLIKVNGEQTTWPYWYENGTLYMEYRNLIEMLRMKYPPTWNNISYSEISKQIIIKDRCYDINTTVRDGFTLISLNSLKNRQALDFDWNAETHNLMIK